MQCDLFICVSEDIVGDAHRSVVAHRAVLALPNGAPQAWDLPIAAPFALTWVKPSQTPAAPQKRSRALQSLTGNALRTILPDVEGVPSLTRQLIYLPRSPR